MCFINVCSGFKSGTSHIIFWKLENVSMKISSGIDHKVIINSQFARGCDFYIRIVEAISDDQVFKPCYFKYLSRFLKDLENGLVIMEKQSHSYLRCCSMGVKFQLPFA